MSRLDEIAERLTAIENLLAEMRGPAVLAAQEPPTGQGKPAGEPESPGSGAEPAGEPESPGSGAEPAGEPKPPAAEA